MYSHTGSFYVEFKLQFIVHCFTYVLANEDVQFCTLNSCSSHLFGYIRLTTDLGGDGRALELLEEEKRLGLPAVNKVDLPTDGLNDREAN